MFLKEKTITNDQRRLVKLVLICQNIHENSESVLGSGLKNISFEIEEGARNQIGIQKMFGPIMLTPPPRI